MIFGKHLSSTATDSNRCIIACDCIQWKRFEKWKVPPPTKGQADEMAQDCSEGFRKRGCAITTHKMQGWRNGGKHDKTARKLNRKWKTRSKKRKTAAGFKSKPVESSGSDWGVNMTSSTHYMPHYRLTLINVHILLYFTIFQQTVEHLASELNHTESKSTR